MTEQEKKIEKLKELLKILEDGVTKEEFLKSFKNVVDLVLKTELSLSTKQNSALNDLKASFSELEAKVGEYSTKEISGAINSLQARVEKSMKEEEGLMNAIRDKLRTLRNGKDADEIKIIDAVLARIPKPKEIVLDDAGQIRDKLEQLKGDERLDKSAINGLEELLKKIQVGPGMTIFGGNRPLTVQGAGVTKDKVTRVINFTGATVTRSADGVVTVAVSAAGGVETPTGAMNSANKDFTVLNTPKFVTWQGQTLYEGAGYSLAGLTITLDTAPDSGDVLRSHY
jgi:hypothetical protein